MTNPDLPPGSIRTIEMGPIATPDPAHRIPAWAKVRIIDEALFVDIRLALFDGVLQPASVTFSALPGRQPVTSGSLRGLSVDRLAERAVERAMLDAFMETVDPADPATHGTWLGHPSPRQARRRSVTVERLREVAAIHHEATAAGRPTIKAVKDRLDITERQASRLIAAAKKEQLIKEGSK